jgi:hypothetical protein
LYFVVCRRLRNERNYMKTCLFISLLTRSADLQSAFDSRPTPVPPHAQSRLQVGAPSFRYCALLLLACLLGFPALAAAPFDCGSTGAYGPMNITSDTTLNLPPDGIFHCTTISVTAGKTLRFTNNALNTPVYLLATGDVTIGGTVDVGASDRLGGPGGFDGGFRGLAFAPYQHGSAGFGPGGGGGYQATWVRRSGLRLI